MNMSDFDGTTFTAVIAGLLILDATAGIAAIISSLIYIVLYKSIDKIQKNGENHG